MGHQPPFRPSHPFISPCLYPDFRPLGQFLDSPILPSNIPSTQYFLPQLSILRLQHLSQVSKLILDFSMVIFLLGFIRRITINIHPCHLQLFVPQSLRKRSLEIHFPTYEDASMQCEYCMCGERGHK